MRRYHVGRNRSSAPTRTTPTCNDSFNLENRTTVLLIDAHHKKWGLVTVGLAIGSVAAYEWFRRSAPAGLTGGSRVGLIYGIGGSALMIYAGLLSALRKRPSWQWLGARQVWLRGHIWLGLLSAVVIFCHSGYHWGGAVERVLWVVLTLTLVTGVFGLALQHFLPRMMTERVGCETPYDQIPHVCMVMRQRADAIVDEACQPAGTSVTAGDEKGLADHFPRHLHDFYEAEIRPFLSSDAAPNSPLSQSMQAEDVFAKLYKRAGFGEQESVLRQLEILCRERRQLLAQQRLHRWLHGWLYLHIPLSVALLTVGGAHAVMSLYY
jgi:hypothetical protein